MTRRIIATAVAALALTGLQACAANDDDQRIREVLQRWHQLLADGHGEAACQLLTDDARRALLLDTRDLGLMTCDDVAAAFSQQITPAARRALSALHVRRIRHFGDRAVIRPHDVDVPAALRDLMVDDDTPTTLRKVGGAWKLERIS